MSLAAKTRAAVSAHPFLVDALRANVCNYTAVARFLEVDGDVDAVATALRRYATELGDYRTAAHSVRVRMESGVGTTDDGADALLRVGDVAFSPEGGESTAIVVTGAVDAAAFATALDRCRIDGVSVEAAGFSADTAATILVGRRDGAATLRAVEAAFERVPNEPDVH